MINGLFNKRILSHTRSELEQKRVDLERYIAMIDADLSERSTNEVEKFGYSLNSEIVVFNDYESAVEAAKKVFHDDLDAAYYVFKVYR